MKIAFIMTKAHSYRLNNRPFLIKNLPDSLTLGILHAIVSKAFPDIDIEIYDETIEIINAEKIHADIIGISALTSTYERAKEYAKIFQAKGIPVFLGGTHASLVPMDCAQFFDSVISGLANDSLVELINDFKNNNLKKIYYQNPQMSFENFVHPTRTLYEDKNPLSQELNMVQATYGCSNICEFCVQPYICKGYHQRPIKDVIEEIKGIKSDEIEFYDPNLAKDTQYLIELCKELIPLKKKWFAPMTISIANNEAILCLLEKSGCTGVLIGFESINNNSIKAINKGFNKIEKYKEAVQNFHNHNIEVTGSFVLGLDGDTLEIENELLSFIIDAQIDYPRFTINTPYPGTPYFDKLKAQNRILTNDYSQYDCRHCVLEPTNMSKESVEKIFRNMWKKTYTMQNIIPRLSYIKTPMKRFVKTILNYIAGKTYIKTNLHDL